MQVKLAFFLNICVNICIIYLYIVKKNNLYLVIFAFFLIMEA